MEHTKTTKYFYRFRGFCVSGGFARMAHQLATAAYPGMSTAFAVRPVGCPDVLAHTPAAPSGRPPFVSRTVCAASPRNLLRIYRQIPVDFGVGIGIGIETEADTNPESDPDVDKPKQQNISMHLGAIPVQGKLV
jgi:hypothetical protein